MTVAFLAHQQGAGGIGRFVRELAEALPQAATERGVDVEVLGRRWGSSARGGAHRVFHEQMVARWATRSAALVHSPDHRPIVMSRTPFVLTVHDVFFLDRPDWFAPAQQRYKAWLLRLALRQRPRRIVCVSQFTKSRLLHHAPHLDEGTVRVIYPGVRPPANQGYAHESGGHFFLTVSTIEPRKNFDGLLAAFRNLRRQGLDLRWKIVGGFGYRSKPIAEELRAADGVDVLGPVSDEFLDSLYRQALFVASPSHAEGFGFPPLEAMARGVPCLCSGGSAYDEVVGGAALQVESNDRKSWVTQIERLAADSGLRRELVAKGLKRAAGFTWSACAGAHADMYLEAL